MNSLSDQSQKYIRAILKKYPCTIILKNGRVTKYGDFRFEEATGKQQITINNNLSPDAFLFVLIHELAHRVCFEHFKRTVLPHGEEWKRIFSKFLFQALDQGLFSNEVITPLTHFAKSPRSVVSKNHPLHDIMFPLEIKEGEFVLNDLQTGQEFVFRKKKYVRLEKRRTRILCEEWGTKKRYLFNASTLVRLHL